MTIEMGSVNSSLLPGTMLNFFLVEGTGKTSQEEETFLPGSGLLIWQTSAVPLSYPVPGRAAQGGPQPL